MTIWRRGALIIAALGAFATCGRALAQTPQDGRLWLATMVSGSLSGRLLYVAEGQFRTADGVGRTDQILLRPSIGWKVSDRVSVYQGYAHVILPNGPGRSLHENRTYQQLSWTAVTRPDWQLFSRTRLEQRWRTDGDQTAWRLRQQAKLRLPLPGMGKNIAAIAAGEMFLHLNTADWGGVHPGFDQMRSFVGAELPVARGATMEVGYLRQDLHFARASDPVNHIAQFTLTWKR